LAPPAALHVVHWKEPLYVAPARPLMVTLDSGLD
jgi:hypothetical protein